MFAEKRSQQGGNGHIQESKLQITMDLGLECNLNVEVEVQPEPERVALALVSPSLLLNGVARDTAKRPRCRVDETPRCILDIVEREVVEGPALAASLLALVAFPPGGLVILGLFALRFVRLLLAPGLLLF